MTFNNLKKNSSVVNPKFKKLNSIPKKKLMIITCMDTRINPYDIFNLKLGDAHILRNAGGRVTSDILRSIIISYKLLQINTIYLMQHTQCGLMTFKKKDFVKLISENSKPAFYDGHIWLNKGKKNLDKKKLLIAKNMSWYNFGNLNNSLNNDLKSIRSNLLIPKSIKIFGFIYHVESGKLLYVNKT